MEKIEKLVWGVIGVGDVCEKKSAPALKKVANSTIKTVMRRNEAKVADYARRHEIPHYTTDANTILEDPEINAVYIATPPSSHADFAIKAAAAGKITYVEKPMAATYNECLEMVNAFEKANLPLFIAYYRRALPNFLKVKALIDSGVIGAVRTVNITLYHPLKEADLQQDKENWRVQPEVAGGGYFHDLASHQLDVLDFILGAIKEAKGITTNQAGLYSADDLVTASWMHNSGVLGSGSWCFTTAKSAEQDLITIVGATGKISFATFANSKVYVETDSTESSVGPQMFDFEMPEHIQQPLIQTMVDELLGKGKCDSTGVSAARTNQVLDWISEK